MTNRTIKALHFADMVDMGGMPIRQPLPSAYADRIDPFLLLHHHIGNLEPGNLPGDFGVGPHPHRGFSPVTFIFKGDIHHRDSRGNSQVVKAGGVQWMDAGMGIIHSERPSKEFAETGGEQEIIQLWINTPQAHKMDQPNYQALQNKDIPKIKSATGIGEIDVVAGNYNRIKGPAKTKLDLIILKAEFNAGASHTFEIPEKYNAMIYILNGSVNIDKYGTVPGLNLVEFKNDGDQIKIDAHQQTQFLLLAGVPINEKVETYGPFVMTSQTEVMQAIRDYQMGKMGILIED
ncbi:MAG: pirin family protein [Chitinophagales bacterium]